MIFKGKDVKLLIAGGRDFIDYERLEAKVRVMEFGNITVISGMARGADALGVHMAQIYGLDLIEYPAQWDIYGKSAGFKRNEKMLVEGKPDVVIAFWDGKSKGTAHTISRAKALGITCYVYNY